MNRLHLAVLIALCFSGVALAESPSPEEASLVYFRSVLAASQTQDMALRQCGNTELTQKQKTGLGCFRQPPLPHGDRLRYTISGIGEVLFSSASLPSQKVASPGLKFRWTARYESSKSIVMLDVYDTLEHAVLAASLGRAEEGAGGAVELRHITSIASLGDPAAPPAIAARPAIFAGAGACFAFGGGQTRAQAEKSLSLAGCNYWQPDSRVVVTVVRHGSQQHDWNGQRKMAVAIAEHVSPPATANHP